MLKLLSNCTGQSAMNDDAGSNLLRDWIERAARTDPNKPWVISAENGGSVSYGELLDTVGRFATFLRERNLGPNDRVALLANNSIEQLLCYLGVMAAGATICTINVEMNRNQLGNIFERLKPKLILQQDGLQLDDPQAEASAPQLRLGRFDQPERGSLFDQLSCCQPSKPSIPARRDDDAVVLFTSGTGAQPKGVVLSYRELLLNIDPLAEGWGLTADDRLYDFRPFSWNSAQTLSALGGVNRGATLILAEKFSASRYFQHLRDHSVTIATGNPTTINILLNSGQAVHRDSLPELRFITSSSAPLLLGDWKRFEEKFSIPVSQGCGTSEVGWIAASPGERRRLGTVGRPFAYLDLAVVDADGQRLPPGEIGYVELGGWPDLPFRYLGEDGNIKVHSRGRLRTGDLGCFDPDGFLMLTGREKEQIIRGGAKISPVEIDSYLMQRGDVVEAATVGVPDPIYGEEVVSYVVPRPGVLLDADELLRYCATVLPAFKAPKRILFADSLPKTERGKLDRKALASRWKLSQP
jgi:acyl-coenzyme A synthetase/AMP-(fatty) acid ligase